MSVQISKMKPSIVASRWMSVRGIALKPHGGHSGLGGFRRARIAGGFVLLEAMLALAIFVFAVLSLARAVEGGLQAAVMQRSDARASRALLNWMRELEAGSIPYEDKSAGTELRGEFSGMRMRQLVVPLELRDQNGLEIAGMLDVTLTVSWPSGNTMANKELRFYAYPLPQ